MGFEPERIFSSFEECVQFLHDDAKRDPWIVTGVLPRYLFRGENGRHETTLCGESRPDTYLLKDGSGRRLTADDRAKLQHLIDVLLRQLRDEEAYGLDAHEALGFLQHYGLPTRLSDFSADLDCAKAFAGSGSDPVGCIAVMRWPEPSSNVTVHQFWDHPWASRAHRQKAVGVSTVKEQDDLKSHLSRSRLGLKWYQFPVSDDEREHFRTETEELLDYRNDEAAGFLRFHVTEYVEAHGKLSPTLAEWLLAKIPIAVYAFLVKKVDLSDAVVNFRATERFPGFRREIERLCSLRYWSSDYPDDSRERMENWKLPDVGVISADPRTYHPAL